MRNIFNSFLIFFFIITIFSCGKSTEENVNDTVSKTNDTVVGGGGTGGTGAGDSGSTTNSSWTKQLGSSGHEFGLGVTTDSSDNIYVTGMTYEDVVCTRIPIKCIYANRDIILIKYNSSGTKQWTKLLDASSGTYGDYGFGVTPDSSGNIYVSGHTYRGDFDGKKDNSPSFRTETDLFLVKYNSSGTKQWTKQLKTPASDRCGAVTTDSSGNIYMTGHTLGGLNGYLIGGSDLFLIKFNSSGKRQWTKQLGTSDNDQGRGVTTDSSDNIYVSGNTWGGLGGKKHEGKSDIFLIKFNSSGTKKWIRQFGTSKIDWEYGVTTDSSDNIYVTGYTEGGLDGNTSSGGKDIFLVKYNSKGTKKWTKQLGTSDNDSGESVTTDSSDNIYVTGWTQGGLDGNTNSGYEDIILIKYNSSGTKQ